MDWLLDAAVIAGMFILRLGVPLAITLAVGYWLRRLDARWQAEARAQWEASQAPGQKQATPGLESHQAVTQPCWRLKGCPKSIRSECPAFKQPNLPCWLARLRAEGRLPVGCRNCDLFTSRQMAQSLGS